MSQEPEVQQSALPDVVLNSGVTVNDLINQYDQVLNDAAARRAKLSNKIEAAVETLNLDPNGDPELLEAQIKLLDQGDKLIVNREKAFLSRIQMRVKHQETESQSKMFESLTSKILKELDANSVSPYVINKSVVLDEDALKRIDAQLSNLDAVEFNDGEVRKDSTDLS